jgi:hypothetical protein
MPKFVMTNPRIVQPLPVIFRPLAEPALEPLRVMSGLPAKPGCVVASSVVPSPRPGSELCGEIVLAPEPMENETLSAPAWLLASRIAWRSEPAPESLVLVTT